MITEDMQRLYALKKELKSKNKKHNDEVKPLKDQIHLLEADIIEEVLKAGKTIQVENIRAEYVPTVKIKIKKAQVANE